MKKYKVHVSWTCNGYYYVEAENEEEAMEIVYDIGAYPEDWHSDDFSINFAEELPDVER